MILTAEEKATLHEFFRQKGLFHHIENWPEFMDVLEHIDGGNIEWGVRNDFAVHQALAAVMKRNESFRSLLREIAADRRRSKLVFANSSNEALKKRLLEKINSAVLELRQMFYDALRP